MQAMIQNTVFSYAIHTFHLSMMTELGSNRRESRKTNQDRFSLRDGPEIHKI